MVVIVYSHPGRTGHNGYILDQVTKKLDAEKKSYKILDLYKMKFNPVLLEKEHYTSGGKFVAPEIKRIHKLFEDDKEYIFIYPTWWYTGPAILKGFLDRVFTPGWAYRYTRKKLLKFIPLKLLTGKATIITTTGAPWPIFRLLTLIPFTSFVRDSLEFCGIKSRLHILPSAKKFTGESKQRIEKLVSKLNF